MTPLAYIGPGTGFVFVGSFLTAVFSALGTLMALLAWPFRVVWLLVRAKPRVRAAAHRKVVVLGLDGLDPALTERFMAEGKMPTFARLARDGWYSRLRTTFPPLSPVAWSTFATGVNPAKHNIFDFLNRDLRTYVPELSSARVRIQKRKVGWGSFAIPFSRPSVEFRRKSEAFWKILGRYGIPSTILRVPVSFPPENFYGRQLSAMSTPDLLGTQGTFSWFSSDPRTGQIEGGLRCTLTRHNDEWTGELRGPEPMKVPFRLRLTSEREAKLAIQGRDYELKLSEYSPWIRLRFANGWKGTVYGIARFLLTSHSPLALYVTPVQIDPERPSLPISQPRYYASYLAKLMGAFSTLGMAEDTWALNEGAIDEGAFLAQAQLIQREREAMFFSALDHARRGAVACVFDHTDRIQHMFFRHLADAGNGSAGAAVIEDMYRDCDRLLAETLRRIGRGTALFVLSDHGFCAFRRGVNLNCWLHREGYLALQPGFEESGPYLEHVDWTRTRAYTFGLSGVYLNLRRREKQGIVEPADAVRFERELIAKLSGLRDENGATAIQEVYAARDVYSGPYRNMAPDLVVGYAEGYRASWSAAVGRVTASVFEDNNKAWSGDHAVDPALVPGVLFSNLRIEPANPGIEDMAPTILRLFGVPKPEWMEGEPLVPAG